MNEYKLSKQLVDVIANVKIPEEIKIKKVKYLLYLGADVNAIEEKEFKTALMLAAENDEVMLAKVLLEKGADVNELCIGNYNVLMLAADSRSENVAEIFMKEKQLFEQEDYKGRTAIELASRAGALKIVQRLFEEGAVYRDKSRPCLFLGAGYGHLDVVKFWLDKGKDVNYKNKYGQNALMTAAKHGQTEMVQFLLEKGAKVNEVAKDGSTALLYAINEDYTEIVKVLLDNGATFDIVNKKCMDALTMAVFWENKEVQDLLKKKIDENKAKEKIGVVKYNGRDK